MFLYCELNEEAFVVVEVSEGVKRPSQGHI